MSLRFYPLTIKEINQETSECISISFHIPEDLKEIFAYKQGQNVTIKTNINGEDVRRTYSLCSTPLSNEFRVAIKLLEGGLFSNYVYKNFNVGDVLDVMPPIGKFYTEVHANNTKNYVAFAAGSGITPIMSIIKTILLTEPNSKVTLVYGNKKNNSIIFKEDIHALKNKFLQRFQLIHTFSREQTDAPINFGRIDVNKLNQLSSLIQYNNVDEFFICGPEEMTICVKNFLEAKNIHKQKIHFELFIASGAKSTITKKATISTKTGDAAIYVKVDGRSFNFNLPNNSNISILDAAIQQGADLPYSCKGGVCTTCKAKLIEGKVEMDVHWGLEQEEIDKGYILTCQSHPITEKVVVDFDQR
ncbi:MAG: phenylacetate-CoA oxygenase/reductase subunit PaaK [Chitinophagaceae bacterium]|nr:phenylacetate-CoA oxygenase/reductase subunit PaaK [Chitinophagaceae bacterium]MCW5905337.1 phenylacetate-CoA oxygenase/reductase subunit PaaK [Chitinophagaceae bacterium]